MLVNAHKLFVIPLIFIGWNTVQAQEVWKLKQCTDTAQVYNKTLQINRNHISISEQREKEVKANLIPKVTANDLIQVYLEDRLNNIDLGKRSDNSLIWTTSKTALTELIYALYCHRVFNNGNTDIKLIARTFEDAFNIELGDFYHTFMELKARKINRTKFLDSLSKVLIKKIDEEDEK
ncbi:RteC domain-containing protein [Myroides injenensis]